MAEILYYYDRIEEIFDCDAKTLKEIIGKNQFADLKTHTRPNNIGKEKRSCWVEDVKKGQAAWVHTDFGAIPQCKLTAISIDAEFLQILRDIRTGVTSETRRIKDIKSRLTKVELTRYIFCESIDVANQMGIANNANLHKSYGKSGWSHQGSKTTAHYYGKTKGKDSRFYVIEYPRLFKWDDRPCLEREFVIRENDNIEKKLGCKSAIDLPDPKSKFLELDEKFVKNLEPDFKFLEKYLLPVIGEGKYRKLAGKELSPTKIQKLITEHGISPKVYEKRKAIDDKKKEICKASWVEFNEGRSTTRIKRTKQDKDTAKRNKNAVKLILGRLTRPKRDARQKG